MAPITAATYTFEIRFARKPTYIIFKLTGGSGAGTVSASFLAVVGSSCEFYGPSGDALYIQVLDIDQNNTLTGTVSGANSVSFIPIYI